MDRERRCFLVDRFFNLGLPPDAGAKVVLIQPDRQPRRSRVRTIEKAAFQLTRSISVGARMAQEQTGSSIRCYHDAASSPDIGPFQTSEARSLQ